MAQKVLTAAIALIKVKDSKGKQHTIGKMKSVRLTENISRGRVVGIGEITPSELPVLGWSGSISVGQYAIKLNTSILQGLSRQFSSTAAFVQNLLFDEGVDIQLQRKIKKEDGTFDYESFATVQGAHLTSEGLDISEGQIGGRDGTFEYQNPILYTS